MRAHLYAFWWNDTAGLPKGNYTIGANATVADDNNLGNNWLEDGTVTVHLVGDVSGPTAGTPDGFCNFRDISYLIPRFNTKPGPNWNCDADLNGDGVVNMRDIAILNFNERDP